MMVCRHCKAKVRDRKGLMSHRWKAHRKLMHAGRRKATVEGQMLRAGGQKALDVMLQLLRDLPNEISLGAARKTMSSMASALKLRNPLRG